MKVFLPLGFYPAKKLSRFLLSFQWLSDWGIDQYKSDTLRSPAPAPGM